MDLDQLVLAIRRGDARAWTKLGAILFAELHRFFQRSFDDDAASDLAQQTLIVVSAKLANYQVRAGQPLRAWVHGIARLELRNALRRQRRAVEREHALALVVATPPPNPSSVAMWLERRGLLHEELEKLPDRHRRVIEHELADGDARELAEREHVDPHYARVLQQRARGQLRDHVRARAKTPLPRISG
jgi:RNA polymerase sigma factor (sigma-70 family)